MGYEDYISETEAAHLAGVSLTTLNRFAEAGYLQIEDDSDGLRLFSKKELKDVFGIQNESLRSSMPSPSTPRPEWRKQKAPTDVKKVTNAVHLRGPVESLAFAEGSIEKSAHPQETTQDSSEESTIEAEPLEPASPVTPPKESEVQEAAPLEPPPFSAPRLQQVQNRPMPELGRTPQIKFRRSSLALEALEQDVTRLQNVVQMQEQLLDLRDKEITQLRELRDWLQSRIERLEEKSERDQLLLLSEKQLLRQVLLNKPKRISPIRAALDWLGVTQSPSVDDPITERSSQGTIEVPPESETQR